MMRSRVSIASERHVVPVRGAGIPPLPVTGGLAFAYALSALAAALLVISSIGGLVYGGRGLYQPDPILRPQFYGQDVIALALAVPLLLVSMWMASRGSARGLFLWMGMLLYVVYGYYFYVAGVRFGPLFLVHVALVSASLYALLGLLARIEPEALRGRFAPEPPVRAIGGFLVAVGALFALLWVGDVIRRLRAGEALDVVARTVYAIDLVVVMPAMIAAGVGLWRRRPWAYAPAGLLLVKAAGYMLTLLANTALVWYSGQPVDARQTAAFAVTALATLTCATVFLRAIRQRPLS